MIHSDGTIEIESPRVIITPKTMREDFLVSPLFLISQPLNQNAPWSRYSFKPITANDEQLAGDICFCSGVVYSLSFCSMRLESGMSWNEYSAEREQARHCFHKKLLKTLFVRPPDKRIQSGVDDRNTSDQYNFPWGLVCAEQDIKGGASYIFIKYGNL